MQRENVCKYNCSLPLDYIICECGDSFANEELFYIHYRKHQVGEGTVNEFDQCSTKNNCDDTKLEFELGNEGIQEGYAKLEKSDTASPRHNEKHISDVHRLNENTERICEVIQEGFPKLEDIDVPFLRHNGKQISDANKFIEETEEIRVGIQEGFLKLEKSDIASLRRNEKQFIKEKITDEQIQNSTCEEIQSTRQCRQIGNWYSGIGTVNIECKQEIIEEIIEDDFGNEVILEYTEEIAEEVGLELITHTKLLHNSQNGNILNNDNYLPNDEILIDTDSSSKEPTADKFIFCAICRDIFTTQRSYRMHYTKAHSTLDKKPSRNLYVYKNSICDTCGKGFASDAALGYHKRTHTGERPYHCPFCTKTFSMSQFLRNHVRIHTGERPYKCHLCPKAFVHKAGINRHIMIHTGEKRYACEYCGMRFIQSNGMKAHVNSVHLKIPAPPRIRNKPKKKSKLPLVIVEKP